MSPTVVLVPGFATSAARTWGDNGWLDLLHDIGREAVALDMLGSGTAEKPHDPSDYSDLELELLGRFPEGPIDGIGFSMGARTLLYLAATHSERFNSLVVAGVGRNLFERDATGDSIASAIDGSGDVDDPTVRYFVQLSQAPDQDPIALAALMRRTTTHQVSAELLSAITCPVLVVLGDRDFAGPADPLIDALPNARLVTLRNVDHFATPKDFGFIDAALEFLSTPN